MFKLIHKKLSMSAFLLHLQMLSMLASGICPQDTLTYNTMRYAPLATFMYNCSYNASAPNAIIPIMPAMAVGLEAEFAV